MSGHLRLYRSDKPVTQKPMSHAVKRMPLVAALSALVWACEARPGFGQTTDAQQGSVPLPPVRVTAASPSRVAIAARRPQPAARRPPASRSGRGTSTGDETAAQQIQVSGAASGAPLAITAASEQVVSGERINAEPAARVGEVLEMAPGLVVTQHSGEGKANQYFLRGFNLDHGTDLAITVDGMPVNMRTHGHGQGYADINFLIPELVKSMRVRKGPYFSDEGDFSSAGALKIDYIDKLDPGLAQVTGGSFGYWRGLTVKSLPVWAGNVLIATEANTYDGPWDVPDRVRKLNGVIRYSEGTATDGFSLTGMGYANRWTSTDQVAERAITSGLIDRFGSLDPSDGGDASRFSLSSRFARTTDFGLTEINAYAIRSTLTLFNNFTYFLDNPDLGDQFSQFDRRTLMGVNASQTIKSQLGVFDTETRFGIQQRYDDIEVGLLKTVQRMTLSTVRDDHVREASVGLYAQNTTRWLDWYRTIVGIRGDWYGVNAFIASPKFGMVFGPFAKTELFLNAGTGFHSNDARGSTITVDPNDRLTPVEKTPLLVRSKGAEIGVRTTAVKGVESAVSLFVLDFASELLFVGDAGTTEASRPSRRVGVEWTNHYKPVSWLGFDVDIA
jgi:hypothetical protein